jgi:hypothetical protein
VTKPIKVMDVTDPATGEVKRWSNGDPKKQVVIELQTELRESEDDDGSRTLWAKGQMVPAIRDAVQRAGAKGIMPGSILQVTWSDEKPSSQRGLQAQKIYAARYWPPEQVPQEVPPSPGDRPAAPQQYHQPAAPAYPQQAPQQYSPQPQQTPWQQAEAQYAPPQVTVGARPVTPAPPPVQQQLPVSAPPAAPQGGPPDSFLDRLRQTSAAQQQYQEQRGQARNAQGQYQDDEPPF